MGEEKINNPNPDPNTDPNPESEEFQKQSKQVLNTVQTKSVIRMSENKSLSSFLIAVTDVICNTCVTKQ